MVVKGKRLTQKEHWQKLKKELEGMDRKQKLEHLWEYYKWVLFVAVLVVVIIAITVSAIISANTETLLNGAVINLDTSQEGFAFLQDGYYQRAKTEGRQRVGLAQYNFIDPLSTTKQTYGQTVMDNVNGQANAGGLDYVIYDEVARPYFLDPMIFTDLRLIFSEEELAAMGNAVIKLKMADTGEIIPLAIDIRDTCFYADYEEGGKTMYISFVMWEDNGKNNRDRCRDFWQYLKGGKTQLLRTCLVGTVVDAPITDAGKTFLGDTMFEKLSLTQGDHRIELAEQSFRHADDGQTREMAELVRENVCTTLKNGELDYVLCDRAALDSLDAGALLDLETLIPELESLGDAVIRLEDGTPVALDLSKLPNCKSWLEAGKTAYLVFGAGTVRQDACLELLEQILPEKIH